MPCQPKRYKRGHLGGGRVIVKMSDAIADFYSKPSGQVGGAKQMGGPMSSSSKYAVPLWKGIKQEIREIVPKAISKLDGSSKIAPKLSKDVRSLGVEETGVKRYRPKKQETKGQESAI